MSWIKPDGWTLILDMHDLPEGNTDLFEEDKYYMTEDGDIYNVYLVGLPDCRYHVVAVPERLFHLAICEKVIIWQATQNERDQR